MRTPDITHALTRTTSTTGHTLWALTETRPGLLVFLRDFGCTFSREAVSDLTRVRCDIEAHASIIVVHMGSPTDGCAFLNKYNLTGVEHVSDPKSRVYEAFGLERGTLAQVAGLAGWRRRVEAGILARHGLGLGPGDCFRMPGVFLVYRGSLMHSFVHKNAADRPDYSELAISPRPTKYPG